MSKTGWRPEGWELPFSLFPQTEIRDKVMFEQGADAMLEALRKTGVKFYRGFQPFSLKGYSPQKGLFVFIPHDPPEPTPQEGGKLQVYDPIEETVTVWPPQIHADRIVKVKAGGTLSTSVDSESGHWCDYCGQKIIKESGWGVGHLCHTENRGISY